ncbi:prepilin-type N-terminal cleavage/methylation domain-containing protein [Syntrophorhabdus aromaticivorans]|uniref:prepilin-type N-terminal cleavage/methylation domain-containing protein n=1 Tax=Syntrophorhabdus aromaticivorans TaxID=328301 RepID=UPI0004284705|nr:prepilin-type N-terminal cleavage/methylation domain-containing protein [Syntrophorhabdus aromaticivorans]
MAETKGFTFVELIIAILLISILITLAAVNWGVFTKKESEVFLEQFSMELTLLREDAISSYQERALRFDMTRNMIEIGAPDLVKEFESFRKLKVPDGFSLTDVIVNGQRVTMGTALMKVYSSGLVDKAILHFHGREEGMVSLVIQPLTARVEAHSGYIQEISLRERNNPS